MVPPKSDKLYELHGVTELKRCINCTVSQNLKTASIVRCPKTDKPS